MPTTPENRAPRVLAVASGGGHWIQLMRLARAFEGCELIVAGADPALAATVAPTPFHAYPDANKDRPLRLALMALRLGWILLRTRPDAIVTTGAAGGVVAIALGRLIGVRGLFIDSIANARELSISARLATRVADRVFTQWPGVARATPAEYRGSVL